MSENQQGSKRSSNLSILITIALTLYAFNKYIWQPFVAIPGYQQTAEERTQQFHQDLSQGNCQRAFREIYAPNDSQQISPKMCQHIEQKFGRLISSQQTTTEVKVGESSDTMIPLTYQTKFSKQAAQEIFSWQVNGATAELVNYNIIPISSPSGS